MSALQFTALDLGCGHPYALVAQRLTQVAPIGDMPCHLLPPNEEGRPVEINKPTHFTKVYDQGWDTLAGIMERNPLAAKVYVFLAKNADIHNAVVCSVELMGKELGYSSRSIISATKWLAENHYLVVAKIATANAYILRPDDIWKTYEEHKEFWSFGAAALVSKDQNKTLKRRMTMMMRGRDPQSDLFNSETGEIYE
jgi:hypothetical protein